MPGRRTASAIAAARAREQATATEKRSRSIAPRMPLMQRAKTPSWPGVTTNATRHGPSFGGVRSSGWLGRYGVEERRVLRLERRGCRGRGTPTRTAARRATTGRGRAGCGGRVPASASITASACARYAVERLRRRERPAGTGGRGAARAPGWARTASARCVREPRGGDVAAILLDLADVLVRLDEVGPERRRLLVERQRLGEAVLHLQHARRGCCTPRRSRARAAIARSNASRAAASRPSS